jgi:hypothetical protein
MIECCAEWADEGYSWIAGVGGMIWMFWKRGIEGADECK